MPQRFGTTLLAGAFGLTTPTALRDQVYPPAGDNTLSYRYVYDNEPRLEGRLERAGVRLAAVLNEIFSGRRSR